MRQVDEQKLKASGFNLSRRNTRWMKVEATDPGGIGEKDIVVRFEQEFTIFTPDQWDEMQSASVGQNIKDGTKNLRGMTDVEGNELEYSAELIDSCVDEAWILRAMSEAQSVVQGAMTNKKYAKALKNLN